MSRAFELWGDDPDYGYCMYLCEEHDAGLDFSVVVRDPDSGEPEQPLVFGLDDPEGFYIRCTRDPITALRGVCNVLDSFSRAGILPESCRVAQGEIERLLVGVH